MNAVICVVYIAVFLLFGHAVCREIRHERQLGRAIASGLHAELARLEQERDFELWEASL